MDVLSQKRLVKIIINRERFTIRSFLEITSSLIGHKFMFFDVQLKRKDLSPHQKISEKTIGFQCSLVGLTSIKVGWLLVC